LNENIVET
jgi:hypothetical protein